MAFLNEIGLSYFWTAIKAKLAGKVDTVSGKGLSTNDYTTAEKTKLSGIATGANAYTLPTASASTLGGVKVGTNLSMSSGVLSAKDTVYTLPTASASTLGGVKVGTNLSISSGVLSATDTKYGAATTSANGLMSYQDKVKLNAVTDYVKQTGTWQNGRWRLWASGAFEAQGYIVVKFSGNYSQWGNEWCSNMYYTSALPFALPENEIMASCPDGWATLGNHSINSSKQIAFRLRAGHAFDNGVSYGVHLHVTGHI